MMERKKILFLCCFSALLLSVGWLRICGLPLLVALVPLFVLRRGMIEASMSRKKLACAVALTFLLWNLSTIWWVSKATIFGGAAAVIVGTLLPTLVFMWYDDVARRTKRAYQRLNKLFAYTFLVVLWLCYEELYMNGEVAFPWLILGNGFADTVWAVQWYEYTGVFGGSLWVLLSNIFVYEAITSVNYRRAAIVAAIITILIPIATSLGIWYGYQQPTEGRASVYIIQPNIDPYTEKFEISQQQQNNIILSLAAQAPDTTDFIVAPETALNDHLWEGSMGSSSSVRLFTEFMQRQYPSSSFIIGATTLRQYYSAASPTARKHRLIDSYYDVYNTAMVIDTTAKYPLHHKSKLVVGVERIPYYSLLKNVEFLSIALGGVAGQLGYDSHQKTFLSGKGVGFATPICYESVYGEYFSGFATRGAQLMFVITNDGWWGKTSGHRQHFDFSRLRAIETRRAVVRSANTGISGVISPRGDVLQTLGWDERGGISASVPLNSRQTLYARTGDAVIRLAWFTLICCLFVMVINGITTPRTTKK